MTNTITNLESILGICQEPDELCPLIDKSISDGSLPEDVGELFRTKFKAIRRWGNAWKDTALAEMTQGNPERQQQLFGTEP